MATPSNCFRSLFSKAELLMMVVVVMMVVEFVVVVVVVVEVIAMVVVVVVVVAKAPSRARSTTPHLPFHVSFSFE
jgi:hypothetical protein